MDWPEHAIWWHVYPLGFSGAAVRPSGDPERALTHRLRHIMNWLDYVVELGCNGLLLGPIFTSASHGYDTTDFCSIDPRLGDLGDFDALVSAAKERGIRIVLDGVFNHVGIQHPAYQAALADPDAPSNAWFRIEHTPDGPVSPVFEGHGDLVELNHDTDATAQLVVDVMRHWLARGIDGWRLDAAYAVPAEFWARVLPQVRTEFPEAWFLGEMIHGDYPSYVAASGLDTVTQYGLWWAIWNALRDGELDELASALDKHSQYLDTFLPQTFIGNHDVNRIATVLGHDHARLAAAILLTVGGIPSIYYGDEEGYVGRKLDQLGGDDEVRPMFPATPADLPGWGTDLRRAYQSLIALRRGHPWLVRAWSRAVERPEDGLVYESFGTGEGERLVVDLELDPPSATISDADGVVWRWPNG